MYVIMLYLQLAQLWYSLCGNADMGTAKDGYEGKRKNTWLSPAYIIRCGRTPGTGVLAHSRRLNDFEKSWKWAIRQFLLSQRQNKILGSIQAAALWVTIIFIIWIIWIITRCNITVMIHTDGCGIIYGTNVSARTWTERLDLIFSNLRMHRNSTV